MTTIAATTTLDAVNTLLRAIGQAPVDSLESGLYQAELAETVLNATSKSIQSGDWGFNREDGIPITPDANREILIPVNALKVDASNRHNKLVVRGNRLYDKKNHSYTMVSSQPVELDITWFLSWDELPEPARQYITVVAARRFQQDTLGSTTVDGFLAEDEMTAYQRLLNFDTDSEDFNLFDNPESAYITER